MPILLPNKHKCDVNKEIELLDLFLHGEDFENL